MIDGGHLIALSYSMVLTTFIFNIAISLYGLFTRRVLIKKIMALSIFTDSINIIAIVVGYRVVEERISPTPPILPTPPRSPSELIDFAGVAVDPLPQAFVITAIVIGLSVMIFLLTLAVKYYELLGSIDITKPAEVDVYEEVV